MSDQFLTEPWHAEAPVSINGIVQVVVHAEGQTWPNCICTTTPEIAESIVRDHNAALSAARRQPEAGRTTQALDYLKAVAQEVASGETSRSALKVALAQIDSEEWWQVQEALAQPDRAGGAAYSPDYHHEIVASATISIPEDRGAEDDPPTNRHKYPGYDLHSYHAFKPGPEPGCNARMGDVPCGAPPAEHCDCPVHLAQTAAYAAELQEATSDA